MHAMVTDELLGRLGGTGTVAKSLGVKRSRVTMWQTRATIAPEFWIPLWCLALERGVPWTPPGGERLAALLRDAPAPAGQADSTLREAA
jgi:hypothetical protein